MVSADEEYEGSCGGGGFEGVVGVGGGGTGGGGRERGEERVGLGGGDGSGAVVGWRCEGMEGLRWWLCVLRSWYGFCI